MIPPPGETPKRTGEAVGRVVGGTVEVEVDVEELAGREVVVVLGLVEDTVVEDTVVEDAVEGGLVDDPVVDGAVVEDGAVANGVEPGVVEAWLVGPVGEVFGASDVGSGGSVPPGCVWGGTAGTSELVLSLGVVASLEVVESPSLKGRRSGSSPVTHPVRTTARTIVDTTRSRTHCHRQIGAQH